MVDREFENIGKLRFPNFLDFHIFFVSSRILIFVNAFFEFLRSSHIDPDRFSHLFLILYNFRHLLKFIEKYQMGPGPWAQAHRPRLMGPGPWAQAHGPGPRARAKGLNFWTPFSK